MIDKLYILETENTYPYRNLAAEEYLTMHTEPGEMILFLWQNRRTVVIGKNQNAWLECRTGLLEEEGGYLVRRLSGGGAVFHDLGNLNFTFMCRTSDYDISRQLDVIALALRKLGLHAEKTGRNDITIDGKKVSGNAFYKSGGHAYHHGTILIDVDKGMMSRYLSVDEKKLRAKGVASVRSRVVNLRDLDPSVTVPRVRHALREAAREVYGLEPAELSEADLPQDALRELQERFESWDWKYGRKIPFTQAFSERFEWGDLSCELAAEGGIILDLRLYSDAMDEDWILQMEKILTGSRYDKGEIESRLRALGEGASEERKKMLEDAARLFAEHVQGGQAAQAEGKEVI